MALEPWTRSLPAQVMPNNNLKHVIVMAVFDLVCIRVLPVRLLYMLSFESLVFRTRVYHLATNTSKTIVQTKSEGRLSR